jgi:hypothetical protein
VPSPHTAAPVVLDSLPLDSAAEVESAAPLLVLPSSVVAVVSGLVVAVVVPLSLADTVLVGGAVLDSDPEVVEESPESLSESPAQPNASATPSRQRDRSWIRAMQDGRARTRM